MPWFIMGALGGNESFPPNAPYAPLYSTSGGFTNTLQRSTHGTGKHCKGVIHPVDSSFFCSRHGAVVHIQQSIVPRKLYKHAPHAAHNPVAGVGPTPLFSVTRADQEGREGREGYPNVLTVKPTASCSYVLLNPKLGFTRNALTYLSKCSQLPG